MYATVQTLPPVRGRVVIVGDLHGCTHTLQQLLARVHFRYPSHSSSNSSSNSSSSSRPDKDDEDGGREADMCVFVGDLVNKGPDSWGMVRLLRDMGATGVLGNHDVKLLELVRKLRSGHTPDDDDELATSSLLPLARSCDADVYAYLSRLPHILHIPQHRVLVVHAGLDPTVALHAQSVHAVTHMRNLAPIADYRAEQEQQQQQQQQQQQHKTKKGKRDKRTALAVSTTYAALELDTLGQPWAALWSDAVQPQQQQQQQQQTSRAPPPCLPEYVGVTAVFGHDARRRLQQYAYAVGLDTGCAYGGELSALLLPERVVVSVPGWQKDKQHGGEGGSAARAETKL